MEFRVLGPLEVFDGSRRLVIASGRQRALLAFLLINANRVVSTDRIIDELWGDSGPESGAKAVAFHVSKLRDALSPGRRRGQGPGVLATDPAGYVLHVDPDSIDVARFEALVAEGRGLLVDDPAAARDRLVEALALWRGEPYADLVFEPFAQPEARRLEVLRLRALEDRIESDLLLGRHADVITELEGLIDANPLRERLRGQLMVALYRVGRQSEALRAFQDGRRLLSEELGIDSSPDLQKLEGWILNQDPRLDGPTPRRTARNPYKGLRPFGEDDSADFFGREALVARLVDRLGLVARASRFLAVVGPSGSGKSSVVRAGLVPTLRAGALPGSDRWRIVAMLPGARPFRQLAAALDEACAARSPLHEESLDRDGGIATAIEALLPGDTPELLLVIDQFEELYSLVADVAERERFVVALARAVAAPGSRLLVIVTLRADFFDRPLLSPELGDLVRSGTEVVTPLARDELERATVRPAEAVGCFVEPGLTAEVTADVARQPGALPLLQYALTEVFERSDGRHLTREAYAAVGGILGALGRRADETYEALSLEHRELARQLFLRLVAPGDGAGAIERRAPRSELEALAGDPRRIDEVLDAFGRCRLLSFDRDAASGEPTVQVAHEALLSRWPRLAGWIESAREDLWMRRGLADAAADWIRAGRDPGFLLAASRLDLFAGWAASTDLLLDEPERALIDASVAERQRRVDADAARAAHERGLERRATTRLRALVAVLAIAALVASSLSIVVYGQGEAAREQGAIATARELAAGAIGNLGNDSQLSLLLAWQAADATAGRGYVVAEAMDALHWALQASHVAYPTGEAPVAVRAGPGGARGVMLLEPDRLMALAASAAGRGLLPEECRTYLHDETCPAPRPAPAATRSLDVYTAAGVVPAARLAGPSLAGSRIDVVSQLPGDLAPFVDAFESRTGIEVALATGPSADLEADVLSGDLPDVAIVSRPVLVAQLARERLLVDLSGIVDVAGLRSSGGDYLVGLGTVGADGSWPAVDGGLYGAPFATEAEGLVWYPRAAFERAGYTVPSDLAELTALAHRMVEDGRTPWCFGLEAGASSGASAAGFVEDLVLHMAGPTVYDRWTTGSLPSSSNPVGNAFAAFGDQLDDGYVLGGRASAILTPASIAALPMFVDPPECWLHLAGGTERGAWPRAGARALGAFPFPAADPAFSDEVRGRAFTVIVFHDRPEVRTFVNGLLEGELPAGAATSLVQGGIWPLRSLGLPIRPDEREQVQGELLGRVLQAGTFRVSASDLMPGRVAAAFRRGMVDYLTFGRIGLSSVLLGIDASWQEAR